MNICGEGGQEWHKAELERLRAELSALQTRIANAVAVLQEPYRKGGRRIRERTLDELIGRGK